MSSGSGTGDIHDHSEPASTVQVSESVEALETRNALRQFDEVVRAIEYYTQPEYKFRLRPSLILQLHRPILEGLSFYVGVWRPGRIEISGSDHVPPAAFQVPDLVDELCAYVNENQGKSPLHLTAYTLWRLNWIHPFVDGNGRTSRALAYLVLCISLGYRLPGTLTIPALIAQNKQPYYDALEHADRTTDAGAVDLGSLEGLLSGHLATQLLSIYKAAGELQNS